VSATPAVGLALDRIFDDASQFPPGNLSLPQAIENHEQWRGSRWEPLVGRLLTPLGRMGELCERLGAARSWSIGVILPGDASPSTATNAVAALGATGAVLTAIEAAASAEHELVDRWSESFPAAAVYLEGTADAVPRIAERGAHAKIRCGGLAADAVPGPAAVAAFLRACADARLPFKATAGLHQPLRHHDVGLGCHQHGFLNVLAATAAAIDGASQPELIEILLAEDLEALNMSGHDICAARELFEAFGTCSLAEPIDALLDIGVLHD
jgi:hypothetical protein